MDLTSADFRGLAARAFISAAATVILGLAVAFVTGMVGKLDKIEVVATAQVAQSAQIAAMKEAADKRKDDSTEVRVSLKGIEQEHRFLIDEVRLLRSELAAERKGR
jgi:hypothetical protein